MFASMARRVCAGLVAALAAVGLFAGAAAARMEPYVGIWAVQPSQCGVGQDKQDAPLVLGRRTYDQHEAHCRFTSIRKLGPRWRAYASCSVEGNKQRHAFTFTVAGDRLTVLEEGRPAVTYRRCK
jgi:hypothetical protein